MILVRTHATQTNNGMHFKPIKPEKIAVIGWFYMESRNIMPGLKQAGKIVHDWLKKDLA